MVSKPAVAEEKRVFCPNPECHVLIGVEVSIGGQTWLRIDNLEVYAVHGRCQYCGTEYHWTVGDVALARIISKCKQPPIR